jgi:hypothetical protein
MKKVSAWFLGWSAALTLTCVAYAGTVTPNGFIYKPDLGARGAEEKASFDAGLERLDARLGKQIWIGDPHFGPTFQDALTAIGSTNATLHVPKGTYTIAADLTVPITLALRVEKGAEFSVAAGKTLTINGPLEAGAYQIFSGSGAVVIGGVNLIHYAAWTGGSGVTIAGLAIDGSEITGLTPAQVGLGNVTNDTQLKASQLDTDPTLAADSDAKVPSQKAVKAYVASAAPGAPVWGGITGSLGNQSDLNAILSGKVDLGTLAGWAGTANITTLGTIATGTWNATAISAAKGGTGQTSVATGDLLFGSAANVWSKLPGVAAGNALLASGVGQAPFWGKIGLTTHVSGILGAANGGTGNGFTGFTGPTASGKTFTLPDASCAILTTNAPVTAAQGGTGQATYAAGDLLYASGATTLSRLAAATAGTALVSNGAGAAPSWQGVGNTTGPGSSIASQIALFDGTTGKTLKVATNTGMLKGSNGMLATATPGSDYLMPNGNGSALTGLTKSQVGLSAVENTALSAWTGSTALTTLGTVGSGTWQATPISNAYIASAAAWSAKEPGITAGTTSQYWRGDKSWQTLDKGAVGLGTVTNVAQLPLSYLDTDTSLVANSDTRVASQKAVKAYADAIAAGQIAWSGINGKPAITVGDTGYATLTQCLDAVTSGAIIVPPGCAPANRTLAANKTLASGVTLVVMPGAPIQINTGVTLTINGSLEASPYQIFALAGTASVVFGPGAVREVYAEWWGAAGDGVTDDSAALIKAVATGRKVALLGRTYVCANQIPLVDNANLCGIKGQTIVKSTIAYDAVGYQLLKGMSVDNITIQNIHFTSTNDTSGSRHCISITEDSKNIKILNNEISYFAGIIFYLGGTAAGYVENVEVAGNCIHDICTTSHAVAYPASVFYVKDYKDVFIHDNRVQNLNVGHTSTLGWFVYPDAQSQDSYNLTITNNIVTNAHCGVGTNFAVGKYLYNTIIQGNTFSEMNKSYALAIYDNCVDMLIEGNIFKMSSTATSGHPLLLRGITRLNFRNNTVVGATASAYDVVRLAHGDGAVIEGNFVSAPAFSTAAGIGIRTATSSDDINYVRVNNNTITNFTYGIWFNGNTADIDHYEVIGNTINGVAGSSNEGLRMIKANFGIERNNTIRNVGKAFYHELCDDVVVENNVLAGVTYLEEKPITCMRLCFDNNKSLDATLAYTSTVAYDVGTNLYRINNTTRNSDGGVVTLTNEAAPDVNLGTKFVTGGTTAITNLEKGFVGQTITILAAHAVTITHGGSGDGLLLLKGHANFAMAPGDTLTLTMLTQGTWHEVGRMVL